MHGPCSLKPPAFSHTQVTNPSINCFCFSHAWSHHAKVTVSLKLKQPRCMARKHDHHVPSPWICTWTSRTIRQLALPSSPFSRCTMKARFSCLVASYRSVRCRFPSPPYSLHFRSSCRPAESPLKPHPKLSRVAAPSFVHENLHPTADKRGDKETHMGGSFAWLYIRRIELLR